MYLLPKNSKLVIPLVISMLFICSQLFAQSEAIKMLSQNKVYHTKGGLEELETYEISPFSPLQFTITGPGKLTLSLIKTYTVADMKGAMKPSTFQIYKDGALLTSISHNAEKNPGVIFEETTEFLPGRAKKWSIELGEETWTIGVLVTPDQGMVGITVEEPEEDALPLVPLVPLVPLEPAPAPAKVEPAPVKAVEPVVPAKPVEAAKAVEPAAKKEFELPPPVDEKVAEPVKEEPKAEIKPEPAPVAAKEEATKDKKVFIMIEPRLGVNLAIQSRKVNNATSLNTNPMFTVGLGLRYVIPAMDQRFRLGVGIDWSQYSYKYEDVSPGVDMDIDLMSIPFTAEFDAFILTKGIFRPFLGLGVGGNYVQMVHKTTSTTEPDRKVTTQKITYALSFWAGCQFNVWNGGPFIKARYTVSMADYDDPHDKGESENIVKAKLLTNADHGGLSFLGGYQFEF